MASKNYKIGFTLIELSIVLVIIGLVVGGILVGRDLIRAAEIRSIIAQKEEFISAVYSFKAKYNCLPGDCPNATDYFGLASNCTSIQTTTATCNGNYDGFVYSGSINGTIGYESFLFWKHLANAGLIAGNFSGIKDGANVFAATANNSPSGKINGSLWFVWYWGTKSGSVWQFNGTYNNFFEYALPTTDGDPHTSILTAQETMGLDNKIDDGKPGTGTMRVQIIDSCSVKADGVTPATYADTETAIYNTSSETKQCVILFPNVF